MMDKIAQRVHEMANILMERTLLKTAHNPRVVPALSTGLPHYCANRGRRGPIQKD